MKLGYNSMYILSYQTVWTNISFEHCQFNSDLLLELLKTAEQNILNIFGKIQSFNFPTVKNI